MERYLCPRIDPWFVSNPSCVRPSQGHRYKEGRKLFSRIRHYESGLVFDLECIPPWEETKVVIRHSSASHLDSCMANGVASNARKTRSLRRDHAMARTRRPTLLVRRGGTIRDKSPYGPLPNDRN